MVLPLCSVLICFVMAVYGIDFCSCYSTALFLSFVCGAKFAYLVVRSLLNNALQRILIAVVVLRLKNLWSCDAC